VSSVLLLVALGFIFSGSVIQAEAIHKSNTIAAEDAAGDDKCCLGWSIVEAPEDNEGRLWGVAALAADDVWAVGETFATVGNSTVGRTLIEHWDGQAWTQVPSPNRGDLNNSLAGIMALSPTDIWAVGNSAVQGPPGKSTLILHWDGLGWSIVPSPNPGYLANYLTDVFAIAPDDVWAVGDYEVESQTHLQTLTMHWDGVEWTIVPSPNPGGQYNYVAGVSGSASDDVWAVGTSETQNALDVPLALHWDGTEWTSKPGQGNGGFYDVYSFSANSVWAAGNVGIQHWNGTSWSVSPTPQPASDFDYNFFAALDGISESDLWAVGNTSFGGGRTGALAMHWDGNSWKQDYVPTPGDEYNALPQLRDLAVVSAEDIWSVGINPASPSNTGPALMMHYSDPAAACTVSFADVPPGSTFYPFIKCMACRQIAGGYPCGATDEPCLANSEPYFRPVDNVTRGQLSKIIAAGASLGEIAGPQMFEDVPPGSPFYDWVQMLAQRYLISGYQCGSPAEPCVAPHNLPYFRPSANASRGQIAKIVSGALRATEDPGPQIFEDVTPENAFYAGIQRLSRRNVMGGYACGQPGEPCVPPENRPYFRPGIMATRGQMSKIISNTFFGGAP
jgi:hypothetical protein